MVADYNYTKEKGCANCGKKDNLLTCVRCEWVCYCSKECQKADWKDHKRNCYKVPDPKVERAKVPYAYGDTKIKNLLARPMANSFMRDVVSGPERYERQILAILQTHHQLLSGIVKENYFKPEAGDTPESIAEHVARLKLMSQGSEILTKLRALVPDRQPYPHEWLHRRPDEEVYGLLTDAYRLHFKDATKLLNSDQHADDGWRKFCQQVQESDVFPMKGSQHFAVMVSIHGRNRPRNISIYTAGDGAEIAERYKDKYMPAKLLVLAAQITGMDFLLIWKNVRDEPILKKWLEDSIFLLDPDSNSRWH